MYYPSLLTLVFISVPFLACSSSSSDTGKTGDSATDSGGTGSLPAGVTAVRCYNDAKKTCEVQGESTPSGIDSTNARCTSEGGTPVAACPAAGLQGCCVFFGLGSCTYDASAASGLQSGCGAGGGTWSTTAP